MGSVCMGDGTANCFSEALANDDSCGQVGTLPSISQVDLGCSTRTVRKRRLEGRRLCVAKLIRC